MSTLSAVRYRDLPLQDDRPAMTGGAARGTPRLVLRLEGGALMIASLAAYARLGEPWWIFAVLFLVPDLSMLGYLGGRTWGAAAYNAAHSTVLPLALGILGLALSQPGFVAIALIWAAHIGFDRMLGYGLKYATAFGHTHLGAVGKAKGGD